VQTEAYRDQYATLFNNGEKVLLLGVSVDPDTTLAAWASEKNYPGVFASDSGQLIGKAYGSTRGAIDMRNLFVIDPTGRVVYRAVSFNVLSQDAYDELGKAVDKAAGVTSPQ
jgi:peroxiredoxin